ncbi:MAG: plasmid mobilization relaxosome protein MobC [Clostridia bacterium]|nr:plasmid mobilization relaxosome protein MobC [Clostridia bacterium]
MPRTQTETISIRLTAEEKERLYQKKIETAAPTLRKFILDMCLNGQIIVNEDLRSANKELRRQGNNLNQLTRLAHQGRIKTVDLSETLDCYKKILSALGGDPNGDR